MSTDDQPATVSRGSGSPKGGATKLRRADEERRKRLDTEPVLHIDDAGCILQAWGDVAGWFGESAQGKPLEQFLQAPDTPTLLAVLRHGAGGVDELQLQLHDGRLAALAAWPCPPGWLICLHDVTTHGLVQQARSQRERLEALADLAGAVARELNDPMAIVQGRLELLLALSEGADDDPARRHLEVALDHARRISATLRNLRIVGQRREQRLERVQLRPVLHDALALVGPRRDRVRLDVDPDDFAVGGDAALYTRVFAHLIRVVVEGTSRGEVRCRARREGERAWVRIQVDSVRAIAASGRSEGLDTQDLTIDRTLLGAIGATVEARRVSGAPAFDLNLPLAPATRVRPRATTDALMIVGREAFTRAVEELLGKDGFQFTVAPDAAGALDLASEVEPSAVVTEFLLSGALSGVSLGKMLVDAHPDLVGRLIVVADNPLDPLPEALVSVPRPLSRASLLRALGRRVRHR